LTFNPAEVKNPPGYSFPVLPKLPNESFGLFPDEAIACLIESDPFDLTLSHLSHRDLPAFGRHILGVTGNPTPHT
jgi:hypothetical protein